MGSGRLVLEDGTVLDGEPFGAPVAAAGEVVFNTGMVGYPESLTDPSYAGQILVLTYPLVGNYGVPAAGLDEHGLPAGFESQRIQAAGLVVWEHCRGYSHRSATRSLDAWLAEEGVPGLAGVDTRALTTLLRSRGTMLGALEIGGETAAPFDPNAVDIVATVTCGGVTTYRPAAGGAERPPRLVLVDCGAKASILRSLLERGCEVVRVPYDHYFLDLDFDGLVLSNGPGDPQVCVPAIRNVERALALGRPILGICLGNQLLALAAGATTSKLPFGHRSQNQPCVEVDRDGKRTRRCVITSQNHGFAVRAESLPDDWGVWWQNANDGSVEGIRHSSKPLWGVQFHPEASPGPVDASLLFDDFVRVVRERRS